MTWFRYAGLILIAGCVSQNDALTPPLVQNADLLERDVLAVIVADHAHEFSGTLQLIPTNAFRFDNEFHAPWLQWLEDSVSSSADREAISDFRRRNTDTALVDIPLRVDSPYHWVTARQLRQAEDNPYHRSDLRGVVIGLSHVGFSRDYRRALVYTTNNCGALCGAGYFVFLERDATNVWRITGKRLVWVS
jgi:hypothetical protein